MESQTKSEKDFRLKCACCKKGMDNTEYFPIKYKGEFGFVGVEAISVASFTLVLCKQCAMEEDIYGKETITALFRKIKRTFYCYSCGNEIKMRSPHLCPQTHFKFNEEKN